MTVGHSLLAGTLSLYSIIATLFLEERDLVNTIGPAYRGLSQQGSCPVAVFSASPTALGCGSLGR
jgi:hypothetical protein